MSLFQSFNTLGRSWDERVMEHQSLRYVFVLLAVVLLLLGGHIAVLLSQVFHHHRFDWTDLPGIVALSLICFFYSLAFYRKLTRD